MKLIKSKLLLIICLCCLTHAVSAQKVWEKPFQQWSKEEAIKILTNSPWVQTYQSPEGLARGAREQVARDQADQNLRQQPAQGSRTRFIAPPPVVIRLHSALPIRQALIRLQQIEAGYDKWDEKKRAEFDDTTKNYLSCPLCKDYYVVTMTKFNDSSAQGVKDGLFQTMQTKELKGNVWLANEKGEKRELVEFTPPKGSGDFAVFFFPRRDSKGNNLITEQSKDFKFVFDNAFLTAKNPYAVLLPLNFEFKVSKMMIGDKVEF
jgi:hypothetical protein